jgi:hypothetical protein
VSKTIMTKIALLNFFDSNYPHVGAISAPNKLEYCMRHNYAYICERIPNDSGRPAAWHKLDMVRRHLPYFDWVFWNDADTLIMNMGKKLEPLCDPEYNIITGSDDGGINTGNFLVGHSEIVTPLLIEKWWAQETFINHPLWEQKALSNLIENDQLWNWRGMIKVLPQREMNSYMCNYAPGDFLIHFAGYGSQDRDNLVRLMREWVSSSNKNLVSVREGE